MSSTFRPIGLGPTIKGAFFVIVLRPFFTFKLSQFYKLSLMKNKKAFVLYADLISVVEKLPDEYAGKLFKIILQFVNDLDPETDDVLLQIAFEPIKLQLQRDLEKWKLKAEKSRLNGKKGGRPPKTQSNPEKPSRLINNPEVKNKPVTDTVTVTGTVKVTDKVNNSIEYRVTEFKNSLRPYIENYGVEMLEKFFNYWTQINPNGRKLHFEKQKTFDLAKRLSSWASKDYNKSKPSSTGPTKSVVEEAHERGEKAKNILRQNYNN